MKTVRFRYALIKNKTGNPVFKLVSGLYVVIPTQLIKFISIYFGAIPAIFSASIIRIIAVILLR